VQLDRPGIPARGQQNLSYAPPEGKPADAHAAVLFRGEERGHGGCGIRRLWGCPAMHGPDAETFRREGGWLSYLFSAFRNKEKQPFNLRNSGEREIKGSVKISENLKLLRV